jgi:hypothetical protein
LQQLRGPELRWPQLPLLRADVPSHAPVWPSARYRVARERGGRGPWFLASGWMLALVHARGSADGYHAQTRTVHALVVRSWLVGFGGVAVVCRHSFTCALTSRSTGRAGIYFRSSEPVVGAPVNSVR